MSSRDDLVGASASSGGPAGKTVGNIGCVASGGTVGLAEVAVSSNGARVVDASSLVVGRNVGGASGVHAASKTRAIDGAGSAVLDHLDDLGLRARGLDVDVVVASTSAVVGLHQTRVEDTVSGAVDADTSVGLLQDNGEDEAVVDKGLLGDLVDGVLKLLELIGGVVGDAHPVTADLHVGQVGCPPIVMAMLVFASVSTRS